MPLFLLGKNEKNEALIFDLSDFLKELRPVYPLKTSAKTAKRQSGEKNIILRTIYYIRIKEHEVPKKEQRFF